MFVLEANRLKKWLGDRLLFAVEQLQIEKGERMGIVGVNGAGKTTLLRVLAGEEPADEGVIHRHGTVAWMKQIVKEPSVSTKSGGELTRMKLMRVLAEKASLLFADEPTSHLDLDGVQWVEKELKQYDGAVLLISHDRALLDAVCTKILEIEQGQVRLYQGNYSDYRRQKEQQRKRAWFEYEQYVSEKKRLTEVYREKKKQSLTMEKPPKGMSPSEARLIANKGKANSSRAKIDKQAKAIQSRINQLEKKEKPVELPTVQFDLDMYQPIQGKKAIHLERISKRFGKKQLFRELTCTIPTGKKVALIGKNGAGKSTLLQMIADQAAGIKLAPTAKIGYFHQQLASVNEDQTILENVRENSPYSEALIRTTLARLLFPRDAVFKPARCLSGGEKVKVALANIFLSDANVLLLDEPTNFLDLFAREELEKILKAYPGTILFASHDRQLIHHLADHVLILEKGKASYFAGTFAEYVQNQKHKSDAAEQEQKQRLLQAENELTEIISRLSMRQTGDDVDQLEKRYQELLREVKELRG